MKPQHPNRTATIAFEPWKILLIGFFFLTLGVLLGWFMHAVYAPAPRHGGVGQSGAAAAQQALDAEVTSILAHIEQSRTQLLRTAATITISDTVMNGETWLHIPYWANPGDPEINVHMGNLYYDLGAAHSNAANGVGARDAWLQSIRYYTLARDAGVAAPDFLTDLGTMYFRTDQPDKAVELYEEALSIDPRHRNAWMNLGVVKRQGLNDVPGAIAAWQSYLEINGTGPDADRVRLWLSQVGVPADQ